MFYQKNKYRFNLNLRLKDDTNYLLLHPTSSARSYKCSKAYIDKNIPLKMLKRFVLPTCRYCRKEDIIMF